MNIKIVDSWLREYLESKANPSELARELSLTSASVERTEKIDSDHVYEIEVTTNRPDLMSVSGLAREASAALPEQGIHAKFIEHRIAKPQEGDISFPLQIESDPSLVNRICAVVLEVEIEPSPKKISERLEMSGIRSLNNVIDVTNYVMREIGHPCHAFDYDLLNTKKMIIRKSKKGESITTLDGKEYSLYGDDIVADDGSGTIIDLLGVMGTANSVVQDNTKRILFFIDNNNPLNIRRTSMSLGIRTEAAILNEKGVDPDLAIQALYRGIELYKEIAKGKVVSKIFDHYPNKAKKNKINVSIKKLNKVIGVEVGSQKASEILRRLGFGVSLNGDLLHVESPTIRPDVIIEEDVIEEIARLYGYHKLPSIVPAFLNARSIPYANNFYFEEKAKNALKYWGFDEVYTYSLVSEDLFDGPIENAVKLKNPLGQEMAYLRNTLVPSLLQVAMDNKSSDRIKIFEMSNVYHKEAKKLPKETLMLSGLIREKSASFFKIKGVIEALLEDLGIRDTKFKKRNEGTGADVFIKGERAGYIEILNGSLVDFELNFEIILKHASNKKVYKPIGKFPSAAEDITFILPEGVNTEDIISEIGLQSFLIVDVSLKDTYQDAKTFHIVYRAEDRNLTNKDISEIREEVITAVSNKFNAKVK